MLFRLSIASLLLCNVAFAKDTIVQIGGIVAMMNKSTSCAREQWGLSDENSCRCCIAKHSFNGDRAQDAMSYCKSKSYCTAETIAHIATVANINQAPVDPDEFVKAIDNAANVIPRVTINEDELVQANTPAGELSEKTAVYLLSVAAAKGVVKGYANELKQGEACIAASKRGGGAQTLQLFSIKLKSECNNNEGERTIYILKEMKKPAEEVTNLEKIRNSDLKRYLPENHPAGIVIALAHQNLIYTFKKTPHFMALLPTAAGLSMNDHLKNYLESKKTKSATELEEARRNLNGISCAAGEKIGQFHRENMRNKDEIFGKTRVHGDLHLDNFFVARDPARANEYVVTLIDDETMAASITNLQDIDQDLIRVYAHATSRFLGKSALVKQFEQAEWNEVFLAPFIQCYMKPYAQNRLSEIKRKLIEIFANTGIYSLLMKQKVLYNPFSWSTVQNEVSAAIKAAVPNIN